MLNIVRKKYGCHQVFNMIITCWSCIHSGLVLFDLLKIYISVNLIIIIIIIQLNYISKTKCTSVIHGVF